MLPTSAAARLSGEEGILRGRADERDHAVLDVGQENILLRLVEAVDLVDEQARPLAVVFEPAAGRLEHVADVLHAGGRCGQFHEPPPRLGGDDLRERRLANAGRPVEDHRREPVGLDEPAEQPPRADDLFLPHIVGQPPRPHPGGERRGPGDIGGARCGEQVGHAATVRG